MNMEIEIVNLRRHVETEASHRNQSSPSIFMVPSRLREVSPDSFNPLVVSIGPLHRDDVKVQAFEGRKSSYLINLMNRIKNYSKEEIWKTCLQKAETRMNRIKACYVWPTNKNYSDAEIAEMMVIDACFILEFTYHLVNDTEVYLEDRLQQNTVMDDLLLLENQIPLFFLDEIHQCTILKFSSDISLTELITRLVHYKIKHFIFRTTPKINMDNDSISTAHHILSLLHQCYKPPYNYNTEVNLGPRICSAIELDMAGVNFKPSKTENPTWVMGIEMKQHRGYNATLTMPVLHIDDHTEFLLRNLVAYEQSFKKNMYFTSFVFSMDMLVNTPEDVAKLVNSGVLVNIMGSNKEAATMINNLGKNVTVYTFYEPKWNKLNQYCNSYWPKHIAKMRSTYFRSPWSIIAFLAGIILFALQVVQTIFTIKSHEISDK